MGDVVDAALRYPVPRGGRVTFEYVLLGGVNDTPGHARELARRLAGRHVKVNLIPLNPAPDIPFHAPRPEAVDAFGALLAEAGVRVSVRRPRGQDILAACGQLHLKKAAPRPLPAPGPDAKQPLRTPGSSPSWPSSPGCSRSSCSRTSAAAPLERAEIYFLDASRAMVESGRPRRAALPGRAVLRQAGAHLLADGRGDEGGRHRSRRRARRQRARRDRRCCSRRRGSARSSSSRRTAAACRLRPRDDPRVPELRPHRDVGRAARGCGRPSR